MAEESENIQRKLISTKSGFKLVTIPASQASAFLLEEPRWVHDAQVFYCQNEKCKMKFNIFIRKHHCRRCGRIYCNKDVSQVLPLPRFSFIKPVRLCDSCAAITLIENEFFDKHIKTLTSGAAFNVVSAAQNNQDKERQFCCRLSPSTHRFIEFQSDSETRDRIDITHISKVQILAVISDSGDPLITGLTLIYQDVANNEQTITIRVRCDNSRKWVKVLQKAITMLMESKTDIGY